MSDSEDQGKWLTPTEAEKLRAKIMELNDLLENATKSIRTLLVERDEGLEVIGLLGKELGVLRRNYANAIGHR